MKSNFVVDHLLLHQTINMDDIEVDLDTTSQEVLLAAGKHDIPTLDGFFSSDPQLVNTRDPETHITPLHAAVLSCEPEDEGRADSAVEKEAVATVKYLFENGSIWNDLSAENETPGCIALRLGLKDAYEVIVEAGVRAEILMNRMDGFQMLLGDDESESEHEDEETDEPVESNETNDVNPEQYLTSDLDFTADRLLDADKNGVMMAWETDIMQRSADALIDKTGLRVLNVGHGMGIVDRIFQSKNPSAHHIIEAHPAVIKNMQQEWTKPGVTIHNGRWQDILPGLEAEDIKFDAIYFDTFAEDYADLKEFFTSHVPKLLAKGGKFGFFNGLGADRQVCQDVYRRVAELDLFEAGMDVEWTTMDVPDLEEKHEWDGVKRSYWALKTYCLPTCTSTT